MVKRSSVALSIPLLVVACSKSPDRAAVAPSDPAPTAGTHGAVTAAAASEGHDAVAGETAVIDVPTPPPTADTARPKATPLEHRGRSALAALRSAKHVVAHIETTHGEIVCDLMKDRAPRTVENFVGLATGEKAWKDPRTGAASHEPLYDGTSFHRVIPGFMIQGGDPKGDGTGEPGFVFDDEIWPGAKHDRPGLLCMANRGKNTNGAQFFITDGAAPHLDGGFTIFGECRPVELVHQIASVPRGGSDRPTSRVGIERVVIDVDGP
jgi:peptidyl-prolyl cis-trans isomerase A (cyclophilin A)